jgi:hypothetical protein
MGRAETLSEYASRFRYPGASYEPRMEEGQAALALLREVTEAIPNRLPREVRLWLAQDFWIPARRTATGGAPPAG